MNQQPFYTNSGPMPNMGPNSYATPMGGYPMNYGGGFPGDQSFLNQQLGNHMAQIFQDQVAQYSDNLVSKSKTWVGNNVSKFPTFSILFSLNLVTYLNDISLFATTNQLPFPILHAT